MIDDKEPFADEMDEAVRQIARARPRLSTRVAAKQKPKQKPGITHHQLRMPDAVARVLKRYAFEEDVSIHSLLVDMIDEGMRARALGSWDEPRQPFAAREAEGDDDGEA